MIDAATVTALIHIAAAIYGVYGFWTLCHDA